MSVEASGGLKQTLKGNSVIFKFLLSTLNTSAIHPCSILVPQTQGGRGGSGVLSLLSCIGLCYPKGHGVLTRFGL